MKAICTGLLLAWLLASPVVALNITGEDTYGTLKKVKKVDFELVADNKTIKALKLENRARVAQLGDEFEAKLAAAGLDVVPNGPLAKEARWTVLHMEIWARQSGEAVVFTVETNLILGVRPCKGCRKSYAATWVLNSAGITGENKVGIPLETTKDYFNTFLEDWKNSRKANHEKVKD